ncbi:vacuolar amino acid transporter 5 [Mitosporidium daphniae]|uniref:Vacuolar amino acid transporter 5 n=1 Tax=Mitosporidium daphniae TaxID=1485682 RepID=A0A098VVI3_9MICR|nr:vacuolar amino acid transporter 5 [Mitosporidium daphniae]KGG52849.1 vacuolar amino acid transporter 5 [Mitosporidium daphniae]|eukprot:XP_013239276.1 vacuolar amino acid transporter 5 [Mitosporidium daphniae]
MSSFHNLKGISVMDQHLNSIPTIESAHMDTASMSKYDELERRATATLFGSGLNLIKITIGAAIISLPCIIFSFGYLLGPLILLIAAIASFTGLYLYLECASYIGRTSSPSSLAESTLPLAGHILDICIVTKAIGVSLSYVMIIGSTCSKVAMWGLHLSEGHVLADARIWMLFMGTFILFPLSMLKTSKRLQFTSAFGIAATIYLVLLSVYGIWALPPPSGNSASIWALFDKLSWAYPITLKNIGFFGTAVFAFSCHQIIFTLFNETKNNKVSSMATMCGVAIGVALIILIQHQSSKLIPIQHGSSKVIPIQHESSKAIRIQEVTDHHLGFRHFGHFAYCWHCSFLPWKEKSSRRRHANPKI